MMCVCVCACLCLCAPPNVRLRHTHKKKRRCSIHLCNISIVGRPFFRSRQHAATQCRRRTVDVVVAASRRETFRTGAHKRTLAKTQQAPYECTHTHTLLRRPTSDAAHRMCDWANRVVRVGVAVRSMSPGLMAPYWGA